MLRKSLKKQRQRRLSGGKRVRKTHRRRRANVTRATKFVKSVNAYMKSTRDSKKKQITHVRNLYKKHQGHAPKSPDFARNIVNKLKNAYRKREQKGGAAPIPEAYASHPYTGQQGGLTQKPTEFVAQATGGRPEVGQVQANSPHEVPPSSRNQAVEVLAGQQQTAAV